MAYTTSADILNYYNGLSYTDSEGNDNNITAAEVTKFINEQTVVIDLTIGRKYVLPITNTTDLSYLKIINDKLVVCIVDQILRSYQRSLLPHLESNLNQLIR